MTGLVIRDDLSQRTDLSKSALTEFDLCQQKSWYALHDRRPAIPNERMTFGSAVDAAVEQIATFLRSGQTVQLERVMAAAEEVIARDEVGVDADEVERAASRFMVEVAPEYDWSFVKTQEAIKTEFPDLGPSSGHPDLIFEPEDKWLDDEKGEAARKTWGPLHTDKGSRVRDVKTAQRQKPEEPTLELGFYTLLVEETTGEPVIDVGYFTWVRVSRPYWQKLVFPVTDELRRWTRERAGAYVRAKKADEYLNRKTPEPKNFSFPGGPKFASLCSDCPYAPANGGPCALAWREAA